MKEFIEKHALATSICPELVKAHALSSRVKYIVLGITPLPELRVRQAACSQIEQSASHASQSASQSIQQAQQRATNSIRQATEQVKQSAAAATRSARDAIKQALQSASQPISADSRSASQAMSSANPVVASIQYSASAAIPRASASADSARLARSITQGQSAASIAVLQAGAVIATATGKTIPVDPNDNNVSLVCKLTQGSCRWIFISSGCSSDDRKCFQVATSQTAVASVQVSQSNMNASTSQTVAITATQMAIAIAGSIIASAFITILLYFLIYKHKQRVKKRAEAQAAADPKCTDRVRAFEDVRCFPADMKSSTAHQQASKQGTSSALYERLPCPHSRSFLRLVTTNHQLGTLLNPPSLPPHLEDNSSQPCNPKRLKHPVQRHHAFCGISHREVSRFQNLPSELPRSPPVVERQPSMKGKPLSTEVPEVSEDNKAIGSKDKQSKASVWTDDTNLNDESTVRKVELPTLTLSVPMQLPIINHPVRNTAEWLVEQQKAEPPNLACNSAISQEPPSSQKQAGRLSLVTSISKASGFSGGLPGNPRSSKNKRTCEEFRFCYGREWQSQQVLEVTTLGVGKAL
ncbi:hypothetical protein BJ878DRAFT_480752 [Calycina marina]|uniref:Uncharacterized protein n=1 Tax=Calycina marina TaxID=1763456 RepID=A0A9P7Z2P9_9HELO|nr:hypothetical protein BJ878DRAFT_480752 [Calycina marina]